MRLVSQKAFLLAFVVAIACHDTSGPPTFPFDFVLDNINGRGLPTFVSPIPEGPTIVSATLHLDGLGSVVMRESERDINQGDLTVIRTLDYRITGNKIEIGCFRPYPANLLCAGYSGTITHHTLSLTIAANQPLVYNYVVDPTPRTVVIE